MNDNIENMVVDMANLYHNLFRRANINSISNKIMIINFYKLGDMVCTIPMIRNFRMNYPKAEITLICSPEVYNYVELMPYVDRIVCYRRITSGKHIFERQFVDAYKFVKQNFAQEVFDLVILTGWVALPRERLMASFFYAKKIIAYYRKGDNVLLSNTGYKGSIYDVHHVVQRTLNIVKSLDKDIFSDDLELWHSEDDKKVVKNILQKYDITKSQLKVVVCLSTSAYQKDWAVEKFAEVCKKLQCKYQAKIILLGAKADTEEYGKKFMKILQNVVNLIGMTSIRQSGLLMQAADVYLGGDTGTLHLAAACKLPGVVVVKDYAGAHPLMGAPMDVFYPWKSTIRIVSPNNPLSGCEICCEKNYAHCINQINSETVWNEIDDVIQTEVLNRSEIDENFNHADKAT